MDFRIKEICKEKGLTMAWLSNKTGIAYNALYSIPNGNPTIGTLQKIADALGVSFIELFQTNCPKCGQGISLDKEAAKTPVNALNSVSLLEYVLQYVENKKQNGLSYDKYAALYTHLKQYGGNVRLNQVNKEYIDGFVEYLKTATVKTTKKLLSEESIKAYKTNLMTVLNSTISILGIEKGV